ncbi:related to wd-repeat protein 8 [Pseudozyma flocculosa]|uniref:Related to wd-repeat protein 8 n=1 Tax=Pseudozyma flocculosa TaxID=84751 RepID=A0A5C3EU90_9BASI|nr:related to wd-repeat protein 8 [Pseudozyma flocculosa]
MDFTAAFRHASAACICYSPGSTFLASVSGDLPRTLLVRASSTLQVIRSWNLETNIDAIEWSKDGSFILVTTTDRQDNGVVYVVSLDPGKEANDGSDEDQGWVARIASGSEGLVGATWTPLVGPRSVVMFSQHQLRASIYSLPDQTISAIEGPKRNKLIRTAKRPDRFAMILKGADRDQIHIFKCERISAAEMRESAHVLKSEEQWQLDVYKLLVYTPLGRLRSTFGAEALSGGEPSHRAPLDPSPATSSPHMGASQSGGARLRSSAASSGSAGKARREDEALMSVAGGGLGLREVRWHPSGKYLALGGYDEQLRILESQEWTETCSFDLSKRLIGGQGASEATSAYGRLQAFREPLNWLEETHARGIAPFEMASLPLSPAALRTDTEKPNPKLGISWMDWSPDGHLIASFNERLPFTLFVHAFSSEEASAPSRPSLLSVLQTNMPIKRVAWKPAHRGKFAVVCDTQALYTWELLDDSCGDGSFTQRAEAIPIPTDDFRASDVRWSPDGQKILIASDQTFCCAFETLDEPVYAAGLDDSNSQNYSR